MGMSDSSKFRLPPPDFFFFSLPLPLPLSLSSLLEPSGGVLAEAASSAFLIP